MTATGPALLTLPEPPPGEWDVWLIEGDRGTGRTTCGARWLLAQALAGPEGSLWAACAPAYDPARNSLKAILAQADPGDVESCGTTRLEAVLRNKARIKGFSSESPDSIRGYNLAGAWFDDIDAIRHFSFYRDGLRLALRGGSRLVVTAGLEYKTELVRDLEEEAAEGDGRVRLTVL